MPSPRPRRIQAVILFLIGLSALGLAACGASPTPTIAAASPTPASSHTAPPAPTLTPTALPGRVLLVVPEGSAETAGGVLAREIQPILAGFAQDEGLELEVRTGQAAGELDPTIRIVVALASDPGIAGLAGAAPDTRFIAVGIPGLQPSSNLFVIGNPDRQAVQEAFLAGYIAALTAPEWRAGMLGQPSAPQGQAAQDAFLNGARYLCGLCNPKFPPYGGYPLAVELPGEGEEAAVQELIAKAVKTVYVFPPAATPQLLDQLSQAGLQIVGSQAPAESLRPRWIASVRSDYAAGLKSAWPDVIAGKDGVETAAPLVVTDIQASALTPGRMRLVAEVIENLAGGWIQMDNPQ